jgi:hypothetical protein
MQVRVLLGPRFVNNATRFTVARKSSRNLLLNGSVDFLRRCRSGNRGRSTGQRFPGGKRGRRICRRRRQTPHGGLGRRRRPATAASRRGLDRCRTFGSPPPTTRRARPPPPPRSFSRRLVGRRRRRTGRRAAHPSVGDRMDPGRHPAVRHRSLDGSPMPTGRHQRWTDAHQHPAGGAVTDRGTLDVFCIIT